MQDIAFSYSRVKSRRLIQVTIAGFDSYKICNQH